MTHRRMGTFRVLVALVISATMAFPVAAWMISDTAMPEREQALTPYSISAASPAGPLPGIIVKYPVNVTETGLPPGTTWTATIGATTYSGTGTSIGFSEPPGSYLLLVTPPAGYTAIPAFESVSVTAGPISLPISFAPSPPNPFRTGEPLTLALGQSNLTNVSGRIGDNASNIVPWLSVFDKHGDLWVSDIGANRVLEFVPPFHTGMNASLVLGQSGFTTGAAGDGAANLSRPEGLVFDASGDLWVASEGSGRVTEFVPPFSDGENASLIIGQPSFGNPAISGDGPTNLSGPVGISFDAKGDLWTSEFTNNRVLEFQPPFSDGEAASLALGQPSLTGAAAGTSAVTLFEPQAIEFDSHGNAWIADWGNDRALEYEPPFATGEAASVVIGQPNFTSSSFNGSNNIGTPGTLAFDPSGNLWIADFADSRALEFTGPYFSIYQAPALVIGEPALNATGNQPAAVGMANPQGLCFDNSGNLWVDDIGDSRVVEFPAASAATGSSSSGSMSSLTYALVAIVVLEAAVIGVLALRGRKGPSSMGSATGVSSWSAGAPPPGASPPPSSPPPPLPPPGAQ